MITSEKMNENNNVYNDDSENWCLIPPGVIQYSLLGFFGKGKQIYLYLFEGEQNTCIISGYNHNNQEFNIYNIQYLQIQMISRQ